MCNGMAAEMQDDSIVQLEGVLQRFSYDELSEATRGFCEESILGHGGFGVVYKGEVKSGIQVAIKRMNPGASHRQGLKEFKSEVFIISQLSHRNLIKLRGWCADVARKEYMLAYDLIPNGSLDGVLFTSTEGTAGLSWAQKFRILTGAAGGLAYLHHALNKQVIHRDIKCSNILLDEESNAKLGDFGIARMVDHQGRAATTDMAGTMGYIAPEVFSDFQFTDKADVFAFGVVILEVACGRRVLPSTSHKMGLVQLVQSAHREGDLLSIVDKRHRDYDTKQMTTVLKVGLICAQFNSQDRPSMRHTVQMLAGDMKVPVIRNMKPTARLFYRPSWLLSIMKALAHKEATDGSSLNGQKPVDGHPDAAREFTYKELVKATNGFSSANLLGDMGMVHTEVYKGTIAGNVVAVKQLDPKGEYSEYRFRREVEHMCRVRHRHLVSLLGYCKSKNLWFLVYEYVPNGTLWEALHAPGKPCMDWATRMKIAIETACALEYLHEACHPSYIHRDVSSRHVRLDNRWGAHLGGFGLNRQCDNGSDVMTTQVMGTLGYLDPDYAVTGRVTQKSDVYSFGVVLLELITGKQPFDRDMMMLLVTWARPLLIHAVATGNVDALADPNLMGNYNEKEMFRMVEVAALCVCESSKFRPKVTVALQRLASQGAEFSSSTSAGQESDDGGILSDEETSRD